MWLRSASPTTQSRDRGRPPLAAARALERDPARARLHGAADGPAIPAAALLRRARRSTLPLYPHRLLVAEPPPWAAGRASPARTGRRRHAVDSRSQLPGGARRAPGFPHAEPRDGRASLQRPAWARRSSGRGESPARGPAVGRRPPRAAVAAPAEQEAAGCPGYR